MCTLASAVAQSCFRCMFSSFFFSSRAALPSADVEGPAARTYGVMDLVRPYALAMRCPVLTFAWKYSTKLARQAGSGSNRGCADPRWPRPRTSSAAAPTGGLSAAPGPPCPAEPGPCPDESGPCPDESGPRPVASIGQYAARGPPCLAESGSDSTPRDQRHDHTWCRL
eukprot:1461457-Rhodomonas_salina.2